MMQDSQSRPWTVHKPQGNCQPSDSCIPEEPLAHANTSSSGQAQDSISRLHDSVGSYDRLKLANTHRPPSLRMQQFQSWAPPYRSNAAQTSPFATAPSHIGPGSQAPFVHDGHSSHGSNLGQGYAFHDGPADMTSASPPREQRVQLCPTTPPQTQEVMLRTRPEPLGTVQKVGPAALAAFDRPSPGKTCDCPLHFPPLAPNPRHLPLFSQTQCADESVWICVI